MRRAGSAAPEKDLSIPTGGVANTLSLAEVLASSATAGCSM